MSNRRVVFFLASAVVCSLLVPLSEPSLRWVPEVTAVAYVVLAVLFLLDGLGRRRPHHSERSGDAEGRHDGLERHQNGG